MSVKGEKYTSMKAMKKHEKMESPAMRMMEYGTKKKAAKKVAKKTAKKVVKGGLFGGKK